MVTRLFCCKASFDPPLKGVVLVCCETTQASSYQVLYVFVPLNWTQSPAEPYYSAVRADLEIENKFVTE